MKLNVFFRRTLLGTLEREPGGNFSFSYADNVPANYALALGMPTSQMFWKSRTLFPVFQVSYPEGFLERLLEQRLQLSGATSSELAVLLASGQDRIGGLQLVPPGALGQAEALVPKDPNERGAVSCLADLKTVELGWLPGVSGGFPKHLGISSDPTSTKRPHPCIVKANDADHPELTVLEFFGMKVAREMGLPTATARLSDDGEYLFVERFDIAVDGTSLQFEDMCSLLGLAARDKYAGSIERVVRTVRGLVAPEIADLSCSNLFGQYLLAASIRNGDAHLKNFGVIYSPESSVQLSPVYDMLTMGAYAPRSNSDDSFDGMALTLCGTKRWPRRQELESLARLCGISAAEEVAWHHRLSAAITLVSEEVAEFSYRNVSAPTLQRLERMLELWSIGCSPISTVAASAALEASFALRDLR